MKLELQVGVTTQHNKSRKETVTRFYLGNDSGGLGNEIYVSAFPDDYPFSEKRDREHNAFYTSLERFGSVMDREFLGRRGAFVGITVIPLYWKILPEVVDESDV